MADQDDPSCQPRQRKTFLMRRGDLIRRPMPVVDVDPAEALQRMYCWAIDEAEAAIAWYQRDKAFKRDGSRLLRALTIILAAAGGLAPLLGAVLDESTLSWGYVLLAAAAGCVAFDRFFGLSSAWMRDITMINSIRRRLVEFELEWAAPHFQNAGRAIDIELKFAALGRFCTGLSDLLEGEATEWQLEFRSNLDALHGLGTLPPNNEQERPSQATTAIAPE